MNFEHLPLVSIRIPLYNHELYIEQCLNSIKNDSYPNKEIVIIDDGSTDNSKLMVEKWIAYNKNDIQIIFKSRPNKGVTKTLNELNDLCKGEYIVGIASDDYLLGDNIKDRVQYMQETSSDVIFSDCLVVNEQNKLVYKSALQDMYHVDIKKYFLQESLIDEIINNWSIPGSTLMVNRTVYDLYKYDEKSIIEDYDFFLFVVSKKKLSYYDKKVSAYRLHNENSYRRHSYIKRQMCIIKALTRNIKNFSWKERIGILKKTFWIMKKTLKNIIKGKR